MIWVVILIGFPVVFVVGFLIGVIGTATRIVDKMRQHGVFRVGADFIVGTVERHLVRYTAPKYSESDVRFGCACGAAPLLLKWDDKRYEELMLAVDHVDSCAWLKRKIARSLETFTK